MVRGTVRAEGEIIVVLESEERKYSYDQLGLTFESSDQEVMGALQPVVLEETGINISEEDLYTIRSVEESGNKYVMPKSPAGKSFSDNSA